MARLADFGCSRTGRLREALSFLGEIMENSVLMLPVLAGKSKLNEDACNSAFCAGVGDRTEVRHTCQDPSGSRYVKVDCEMDDTVYEGGMDKCSSLDSVQKALFFAHLTGRKPVVIIDDTDERVGWFEHRIKSACEAVGVEFLRRH